MSDSDKVKFSPLSKNHSLTDGFLKKPSNIFMSFVVLAAIGAAGFFWQESQTAKENSVLGIQKRNEETSSKVIASLDKILLTSSEAEPTVAQVEDPETLAAADDFYALSQQGDYLILYPQRAIIYRLEENRIINVAPIVDASAIKSNVEDPEQ